MGDDMGAEPGHLQCNLAADAAGCACDERPDTPQGRYRGLTRGEWKIKRLDVLQGIIGPVEAGKADASKAHFPQLLEDHLIVPDANDDDGCLVP